MNRPNLQAKTAILRALCDLGQPAGAAKIQEQLQAMGANLQPRTVRFYLLQLDREGLTRPVSRRAGRELTAAGHRELACAHVMRKVGFIGARIDALVYRMTYDLEAGQGTIVSNRALIASDQLVRALEVMRPVFTRRLGMGTKLAIVPAGGTFAGSPIPTGQMALSTVCSVTVNGLFLKHGIPVVSRFGGLMEFADGQPVRFVELIEYSGTTLDPLEAFIRAGMTQVREVVRTGNGMVGVSFREIPAPAIPAARRIQAQMEKHGLGGILAIGTANQPLFEIPVGEGRAGMIVAGGLNPIAALCEAGIQVTFQSLAEVEDIGVFSEFDNPRVRG